MEYLIGIIVALLGGVFFYRNKAKNNRVDAILAETKGTDRELAEQESLVIQAIKDIDDGIRKEKEKRKAQADKRKNMTLKERADEAKKRYNK